MPPSWSAVAKSGLPQESSKPAVRPESTKRPPTKAEYSASVVVPQLETPAPSRSVKVGGIDIAIDHDSSTQLPYSVPRDPEFWEAQYNEYRRRRAGEQGDEAVAVAAATPQTPVKPKPTSWAALLRSNTPSAAVSSKAVVIANGQAAMRSGRKFKTLEDVLENWQVEFSAPAVQPRGLVNSGNMCFMNVVLQALLYCEPFCSMMRSIKDSVVFSFSTSTPLLEALIQFVHEFRQDRTPLEQLGAGLEAPFVPENVYEALRKKNVFQTLRGQQEDAQEFMSYLVDGIHEEMASVLQAHHAQKSAPAATAASDEDSGWLEVGANNRGVQMHDLHATAVRTPITQIFGGTLQSTLTVPAAAAAGERGPPRSSREPFQWLALDVSSDGVATIDDALDELVAAETIEGYMTVQGEPATATKQMVLERVPPVLVLHLKRFVFCADEGVKKVHKFIEYPAELALAPNWLARSAETARHRNARYRLTGVIYHHGSHASGGHYTCDIQRPAGEWLRLDDIDIESLVSVDAVLEEKSDRTAYILFYTICH